MTSSGITKSTSKSSIRSLLRSKRRELSEKQQLTAARKISFLLKRQPCFKRSQHIAYYWANDGELSLHFLCRHSFLLNKKTYLPTISKEKNNSLLFLPFDEKTAMHNNRFGIPEPCVAKDKAKINWTLDIVFFPLVGFDLAGNRLGMGGGFYDRTFSNVLKKPRRPLLVGVGHSCQEYSPLQVDSWDIPLDAVVTEERILCSKTIAHRFFNNSDCQFFTA